MFRFVKTQGRTDVSVPYQTYLGGPFAHASSFLAVQGPLAKLQGLYDLQMKTIGGVLRLGTGILTIGAKRTSEAWRDLDMNCKRTSHSDKAKNMLALLPQWAEVRRYPALAVASPNS